MLLLRAFPPANGMSALVYCALAAAAGAVAGRIRSEHVPYAAAVCALGGLLVSVLVSLPLGDQGPHLLEVAVLPAAAGALCGAIGLRLMLARIIGRSR